MVEWLRRIVRVMRGGGGGVGKNSVKDKDSSECVVFASDYDTGTQVGNSYIGIGGSYCAGLGSQPLDWIDLYGCSTDIPFDTTPSSDHLGFTGGTPKGNQYGWSVRSPPNYDGPDTCFNLTNKDALEKVFVGIKDTSKAAVSSIKKPKPFLKPDVCGSYLKYHLVTYPQEGNCRGIPDGIKAQYPNIDQACVQGCNNPSSPDGNLKGFDIIQVWDKNP